MKIKIILLSCVALTLAGCGGGSPFSAADPNSGPESDLNIALVAGSPTIGSSAVQSITLTATVTDANNVVKPDQAVVFSSTSGQIAQAASTTDSSGQVQATLSPGNDQSMRTIQVTVTAGAAQTVVNIPVTGTVITIDGASSVSVGSSVALAITAKDSDGKGIPNAVLTVQSARSNSLSPSSVTTDSNGQGAVIVTADNTGADTVTVSGLGTSESFTLSVPSDSFTLTTAGSANVGACAAVQATWNANGSPQVGQTVTFSATRGTFYADAACTAAVGNPTATTTNASGVATKYIMSNSSGPATLNAWATGGSPAASGSMSFGATTPAKLVLSADRTTISRNGSATITAIVRDASDNLVQNATVLFSIVQDLTGGSLGPASVTTDALGRASATFAATDASSQTNGIQIRASVLGTAFSQDVFLTVGDQALGLSIGMANTIVVDAENTVYKWFGTLTVVDSSNHPVPNQPVTLRVRPTSYDKGWREYSGTSWAAVSSVSHFYVLGTNPSQSLPCANEDVNENGIVDQVEPDVDRIPIEDVDHDGVTDTQDEDLDNDGHLDVREDADNDGILDAGEDLDNDGTLDVNEDTDGDGLLDVWTEDWNGNLSLEAAEDTNGNGIHDEDYNVNGRLEPGPVLSVSGASQTDANGEVLFYLRYPKDYASWVDVEITATAQVVGSDSSITTSKVLLPTADDVKDQAKAPPGFVSPFGIGDSCINSN